MWVIWFGPLVVTAFIAGLTVSAVLLRLGKLRTRRKSLAALALPFGSAALPVIALAFFSVGASILTPHDETLFTEVFGNLPIPAAERMIFDTSGIDSNREVLLRLDATPGERRQLTSLPGITRSSMTPEDFALIGTRHGISNWWMRPSSTQIDKSSPGAECFAPSIYQVDGFNGWREFRIAVCAPDRGETPPIFVTAYGR